jgi:hypothetical protein
MEKDKEILPSEIMNTQGVCFSFIYYTEENKHWVNYFLSYHILDEEKMLFEPYLDFDRVIPIPEHIDNDDVTPWIKENWKIGSPSYHNIITDDGISFLCKEGNPSYLVKRMSEIIKEKIKLLYIDFSLDVCGEYLAYPDKDGVHLVYKPIFEETPGAVLHEIRNKIGLQFSMEDDDAAPPMKNYENLVDESGS